MMTPRTRTAKDSIDSIEVTTSSRTSGKKHRQERAEGNIAVHEDSDSRQHSVRVTRHAHVEGREST